MSLASRIFVGMPGAEGLLRALEVADEHLKAEQAKRPRRCAYFLRDAHGGPIKIGYTERAVTERIKEFNPRYPYPLHVILTIPGPARLERFLHRKFAHLRLRGEWFRPDPEILAFIEERKALARDGRAEARP